MVFNGLRKFAEETEESEKIVDASSFDLLCGKFRIAALMFFIGSTAISCSESSVHEDRDDADGSEVLQEKILTLLSYTFTNNALVAQFEAPVHKLSVPVYFDDEYQFESTINTDGVFRIDNLPTSVQKVSVSLGEEIVHMGREGFDPLLGG